MADPDASFDRILIALDDKHTAALKAHEELATARYEMSQQAINKAETAMDKRLDAINEFRAQLSDQAATFMRRDAFDYADRELQAKLDACVSRLDKLEGRSSGITAGWSVLVALVGMVTAAAALIIVLR